MKQRQIEPSRDPFWEKWKDLEGSKFQDYEFPKVSIVIPTYNCAQSIAVTLESVLEQEYPDFEVIIIDGSSTDRTLEVLKSYRTEKVYIHTVTSYNRYEMLNKGITHAHGTYINFLFPGDFYINKTVLKQMMRSVLEHEKPHLAYCGTHLRDGRSEVKILFRPLNLALLKNGQQPTSLQSCWFRNDTFREIGKFNTRLRLRGGFDLLCRFCLHKGLRATAENRVLTDYDLRWVTRRLVLRHFWETCRTVYRYFGFFYALRWLMIQKDSWRFTKLWIRSIKIAFLGR